MIKPTKPGRANRIADQIQRDVAELIQKEVSNPKTGLVTLTGCEITPDYAHATIYFTSIGSTPEEATEALNSAAPMLHSRIFKLLKIHPPFLSCILSMTRASNAALKRIS